MSWGSFARALVLLLSCALVACSEDSTPSDGELLPDEVTIVVDQKGGMLKAKGVTVIIPEGALDKELTITAKKIASDKMPELPKDVQQVSPLYEFGPEGTKFLKDVEVQFDVTQHEPDAKVYFTKEGDRAQYEQLVSVSADKKVSAKTKHFSLGYAGIPRAGSAMDAGASGPDASDNQPMLDGSANDPDAGPALPRVTVTSKNQWGALANQTLAAYQDGDGPWQALSPTSVGHYEFEVTSGRYGFAFICDSDAGNDGEILYALASHDALDIVQPNDCDHLNPPTVSIGGSLLTDVTSGWFRYGHKFGQDDTSPISGPYTYTIPFIVQDVPSDIAIAVVDDTGIIDRMHILRDTTLSADDLALSLDLQNGGFTPSTTEATVTSFDSGSFFVEYAVEGAAFGVNIVANATVGAGQITGTIAEIPLGLTRPEDRYRLYAGESSGPQSQSVEVFTKDPTELIAEMPAAFAPTLSVDTTTHFAITMDFDKVAGATEYEIFFEFSSGHFKIVAEDGWLGSETLGRTLVFPDLSGLPGWMVDWAPAIDSVTVGTNGAAIVRGTTPSGGSTFSRSGWYTALSAP